ncbi:BnaA03g52040D [Brassica napus]|uniref:V-type proton ATPase proteolipid subunit n=2 Tax=Brassica TaxID=3705 RepID=A0A078FK00_BRANA|nr:unnamed protein product [Brassica napus]CDY13486.1 BnaA03g52040D [Brassica napus]
MSTFSGDESARFFGFIGAAAALVFSVLFFVSSLRSGMGAAYGTAKSGVGVASMGVMRPELVMQSIVPVVMAGVLGIYGLIIAVIISTESTSSYFFSKLRISGIGQYTTGWCMVRRVSYNNCLANE